MQNFITDTFRTMFLWLSGRSNRLRLQGARIQVIAFVIAPSPVPSLLLVKSAKGKNWQPPQEGVMVGESFREAFDRCMREECGITLPAEAQEHKNLLHRRPKIFLGINEIPRERWGKRLVADNAANTPLEKIQLRKKAYWAMIALVKDTSQLTFKADDLEVSEVQWFPFDKAWELMESTNRVPKVRLLQKGYNKCQKYLTGDVNTSLGNLTATG